MDFPTETKIVLALKSQGWLTLKQLGRSLGISEMAVLNHIKRLEEKGLIQRRRGKPRVGRPYYLFGLTEASKQSYYSSSDKMLEDLLEYLKQNNLGRVVEEFIRSRYKVKESEYLRKFASLTPGEKVNTLYTLRQQENYMPELKARRNHYELLEYNCPIYRVSKEFPVACELERKLFEKLVGSRVENTHRQIDEANVCRFVISKVNGGVR